jgi:hypothetical protein
MIWIFYQIGSLNAIYASLSFLALGSVQRGPEKENGAKFTPAPLPYRRRNNKRGTK